MTLLYGRGIASVNYPTGMNLGGDPTQALVHATTVGNFVITLSSVDLGQGLKTVLAQIGADPWELRLRNAYRNGDERPYRKTVEDATLIETIRAAAELVGHELPS